MAVIIGRMVGWNNVCPGATIQSTVYKRIVICATTVLYCTRMLDDICS
jgi:hypothetical protein